MSIFRESDRPATAAMFVVAALLATALRVAVIDNDLWLDEVWSVQHAASIESPADIFVSLHHDNNHHLNTLWLWFCGADAGPVQQRLLSLVTGVFAAVFWTSGALASDQPGFLLWCKRMLRCHALAIVCLGGIYLLDVRYLTFGGGPRLNAVSVFINAVSVFAGGTFDAPSRLLYCAVVVVGIIAGMLKMVRSGQDEWKFFACLFVLFPLFRVVLLPAGLMFERYFLILLGFAAIPISVGAMQLLNGRYLYRVGFGLLAILFLSGNFTHNARLVENGRGHYQKTMAMIAEDSPESIRISSDHPFRNRLLIEYFAVRCSTPRSVEYVDLGEWIEPPEWMICHHIPRDADPAFNFFEPDGQPRARLNVSGFTYKLRSLTGTAELSGCEWLCYRLASPTKSNGGI